MRHLALTLLLPLLLAIPAVLPAQPRPNRYGSFRLIPGPDEQSPARLLEQIAHEGDVTVENDELILTGGGDTKLPRTTILLDDSCLDKYFELTVTARGNGRAAQIMLTEGFLWGSTEPVQRYVRHRLPATDDFVTSTLFFHVARLPYYLNFGIYPNDGPEQSLRVKSFTLRETDALTYLRQTGHDEIPVPDRNRFICVRDALKQFTGNAGRLLKTGILPPALQKTVRTNAAKAAGLTLENSPESLAAAEPVLSACETLGVMLGQDLAPESIPAAAEPIRLTLFNLHAPHSVWARFEADIPDVEYRVITPGGEKYRLNQGRLAIVPPYEPTTIEVTGLTSPGRLTIFPLDHHGKNTVTTIEVR